MFAGRGIKTDYRARRMQGREGPDPGRRRREPNPDDLIEEHEIEAALKRLKPLIVKAPRRGRDRRAAYALRRRMPGLANPVVRAWWWLWARADRYRSDDGPAPGA